MWVVVSLMWDREADHVDAALQPVVVVAVVWQELLLRLLLQPLPLMLVVVVEAQLVAPH